MHPIFKSLIGLVVILILAMGIALFIGWASVPNLIATNLSKKLKVAVNVREVDLSWKSLDIEKITISNPTPGILTSAFSAELVHIKAPINRYLHREILIDEAIVDEIYIGLEFDLPSSKQSNWTRLLDNFSHTNSSEKHTLARHSVLIRKLILRNISTDLLYRLPTVSIQHLPPIPEIVLTNVRSQGDFPINQVASSILGQMLRAIFEQENLKHLLDKDINESTQIIEPSAQKLIP